MSIILVFDFDMRKLRSTELKYFLALSLASPLALADNSGSDNFSSRVLEESLENRILDTSELLTRTKSSVSKPALQKQWLPGRLINPAVQITNLRSTQVIQLH